MADRETSLKLSPGVWGQIAMNLAVVIGIIALIVELNQTRELASVEIADSAYNSAITRNLTLLGEAPHDAIAKAIFFPDDITPTDAVILDRYYTVLLLSWRALKDERSVGYFGDDWKAVVAEDAFNLNSVAGRKWWVVSRPYHDPEIAKVIDQTLASTDPSQTRSFIGAMLPEGTLKGLEQSAP